MGAIVRIHLEEVELIIRTTVFNELRYDAAQQLTAAAPGKGENNNADSRIVGEHPGLESPIVQFV